MVKSPSMIEVPNWYVYRTKPRVELPVATLLMTLGVDVYLPLLMKNSHKSEPFFPGYIFVNLKGDPDYIRSRSAPGVQYVLLKGAEPTPIDELVVEGVRERVNKLNRRFSPHFSPEEYVKVVSGPFEGLDAIYDRELDSRGRCRVLLINAFGGKVAAELSTDELQFLTKKK